MVTVETGEEVKVSRRFSIVTAVAQVIFIFCIGIFGEYEDSAKPTTYPGPGMFADMPVPVTYPMFQDVHVMIFVGFGFLMTFLKRYAYSSVSVNFLIASYVIQWAIIVRGIFYGTAFGGKIQIGIMEMLSGDFVAGAVLISFGAVLGKTSPLQLLVMATIEVIVYMGNEYIGITFLKVSDVGGSMFIHIFGAYFGLGVARMLYHEKLNDNGNEGTIYHSDLFSMIGTIFLWLYWPSFNGGAASGDEQHRAVINTYLSLCASTLATFAASALLDKENKLEMVHVQNATLAGGVAIGTAANLAVQPWGAMAIGAVAGVLSTAGYKFIQPYLLMKVKLHDTCGVNNLHGMPGILAGLVGAIATAFVSPSSYGASMYEIFPATVPENGTQFLVLQHNYSFVEAGSGRHATTQAGFQLLAVVLTLVFAIVGGLATGYILRLPLWDNPPLENLYSDDEFWNVSDEGYPLAAEFETAEQEGRQSRRSQVSPLPMKYDHQHDPPKLSI